MEVNNLLKALAEHGPLALIFIVLLLLFHNLIWKVWSKALESKDKEIERLLEIQKQLMDRAFPELKNKEKNTNKEADDV